MAFLIRSDKLNYIMAQKIKTVSVSKEEEEFLDQNNISPTRLLRNKIQEMMDFQNNSARERELLTKINNLVKSIQKHVAFLDSRGILDEFLEQEN